MVYKIRVCTNNCPYCETTISKEYNGPNIWGPKYGRCPKCRNIFHTRKKLYSDIPLAERQKDRKEFLQGISITIPAFVISLTVTIITGWELLGLLAFFAFICTIIFCSAYFSKTKVLLSKYAYLKTSDPELYQLELSESLRLVGGQSIDEIESQIQNTIEHKVLRYLICFVPSVLLSELILMMLLGDSIEGGTAIALLLLVSIPISMVVHLVASVARKKKQ